MRPVQGEVRRQPEVVHIENVPASVWCDCPGCGCGHMNQSHPLPCHHCATQHPAQGCLMSRVEPARDVEHVIRGYREVFCCRNWLACTGFTNTCENCGADYNSAGHRLASREQWGEETGELLSEILAIP